jgi:hypothetical protein
VSEALASFGSRNIDGRARSRVTLLVKPHRARTVG